MTMNTLEPPTTFTSRRGEATVNHDERLGNGEGKLWKMTAQLPRKVQELLPSSVTEGKLMSLHCISFSPAQPFKIECMYSGFLSIVLY